MTTQSPHLYERQNRPADIGAAGPADPGKAAGAQTQLPWWAIALPVLAFATLLALLSGGPAHASTAASGGDLFGRMLSALVQLVHRVM